MVFARSVLLCLVLVFGAAFEAFALAEGPAKEAVPQKEAVYTGIVDQTGDTVVLAGEEKLRFKAVLRAEGFSADNFARFVGHRVEIRGRLLTEGESRVLAVSSVGNIRDLGARAE